MSSFEDRIQENRSYKNFRTSLDVGMGAFYVIVGCAVIYVKYFGTVELPDTFAYVLGGLMVLYGAFRVYRGITAMRQKRSPRERYTRQEP